MPKNIKLKSATAVRRAFFLNGVHSACEIVFVGILKAAIIVNDEIIS